MSEHRKPGVAFWTSVTAALLLAYPLSFGPACWMTSRLGAGARFIPIVYRPMTVPLRWWDDAGTLAPVGSAVNWYSQLGAARGWEWYIGADDLSLAEENANWQWGRIYTF